MRPWYAALDRHVPSCPCYQHGLHRPASPSLVQQRPSRTLILKQVLSEAVTTLRPEPGDRHGPLMPMMIALTLLTGVVDAVSYLRFGHVFVANMTGNIVFLGFALSGAQGLSAVTSLVALVSFLAGALIGGRLGARCAEHRGRLLRAGTAAQVALLAIALILALAVGEPLDSGTRYALLVPMALAMGVQNATVQRLAVPELTTTVLTRTLTGLASESRLAGGPGSKAGRRLIAIAAMLLGALVGGLLVLNVAIAAAIGLASATALAVGIAVHLISRTDAPWIKA
jgi:uncharacterized membrane protein YoaK (UPF0700 family)